MYTHANPAYFLVAWALLVMFITTRYFIYVKHSTTFSTPTLAPATQGSHAPATQSSPAPAIQSSPDRMPGSSPLPITSMLIKDNGIIYSSDFELVSLPAPQMIGEYMERWAAKGVSQWGGVTGEIWRGQKFTLPVPIANCGMSSSMADFMVYPAEAPTYTLGVIAIALAPEAWSWQHFVQDVMPKIWFLSEAVGGLSGLKEHIFLIPPARDAVIYEMMEFMGLKYANEPVDAAVGVLDGLVACRVPGVHPRLWRGIHAIFNTAVMQPPPPPSRAVFLDRGNAANGRHESNADSMFDTLLTVFPSIRFSGGTLQYKLSLFADAIAVVGSHGGAFFNIIFAPVVTCVIEHQAFSVFTTFSGINAEMMYVTAAGFGQPYWRIITMTDSYAFDIERMHTALLQCKNQI